jgi:hypothetical protein
MVDVVNSGTSLPFSVNLYVDCITSDCPSQQPDDGAAATPVGEPACPVRKIGGASHNGMLLPGGHQAVAENKQEDTA